MKARMPVTNAQKRLIREEARREYNKIAERDREELTRRLCKVMMVTLHETFRFGAGRCAKAFDEMAQRLDHSADDVCFWEHIDQIAIDKLGLQFERDYTDRGRASSGG